jgi:hypothetical protein
MYKILLTNSQIPFNGRFIEWPRPVAGILALFRPAGTAAYLESVGHDVRSVSGMVEK